MQIHVSAQNEGRIGIFAGMNMTSLFNVDDAKFGDYLPTFKPTLGVEAGYHFTLFKSLPMGFSVQFAHNRLGQNYKGAYVDSTSYYAYSRLNYLRTGLALHFGTNPRRQVALAFTMGANIGVLTGYQDRYELVRYNNSRYILDIKNSEVNITDTTVKQGTLTSQMYNKTDMAAFGSIGLNFLISNNWVFGVNGRFDYGLSPVENTNKMNINFDTQPASSASYKPFNTVVKYHGPTDDLVTHSQTTNLSFGIFLSLHYRIYNKEKTEFYYKENSKSNN